jgi:3-hydroxyisobutyrate dehydrogenase-like beta-hydroxyacid dehydrogenase
MNDAQVMLMATREVAEAHPEDASLQGHLRAFTELAEKDLALTLAFAREHGVALPGTGLCQQLMARVYGVQDGKRR